MTGAVEHLRLWRIRPRNDAHVERIIFGRRGRCRLFLSEGRYSERKRSQRYKNQQSESIHVSLSPIVENGRASLRGLIVVRWFGPGLGWLFRWRERRLLA